METVEAKHGDCFTWDKGRDSFGCTRGVPKMEIVEAKHGEFVPKAWLEDGAQLGS